MRSCRCNLAHVPTMNSARYVLNSMPLLIGLPWWVRMHKGCLQAHLSLRAENAGSRKQAASGQVVHMTSSEPRCMLVVCSGLLLLCLQQVQLWLDGWRVG